MPNRVTQNLSASALPDITASRPRWDGFGRQLAPFLQKLQAHLESHAGVTTFVANGTLVRHGMTIAKNMEHWLALSSTRVILGTWATPYVYHLTARDGFCCRSNHDHGACHPRVIGVNR